MMRLSIPARLCALVLLGACGTAPEGARSPAPGEPDVVLPHEVYLRRPTEIRGDDVRVILPEAYEDRLELEGLSAGFVERGGKRTWEGAGACRLELLALVIESSALTVTLVPSREPEVVIQAVGNVSYRHAVKGVATVKQGLDLLMITNNIVLER